MCFIIKTMLTEASDEGAGGILNVVTDIQHDTGSFCKQSVIVIEKERKCNMC